MQLILIHEKENMTDRDGRYLRFALSGELTAGVVLDGLGSVVLQSQVPGLNRVTRSLNLELFSKKRLSNIVFAIPKSWNCEHRAKAHNIITYSDNIHLRSEVLRKSRRDGWFIISNGQFATQINIEMLSKLLTDIQADVVAVNVKPQLLAYREKVRITAQNKVAGFRRLYFDSAEPAPFPIVQPHHIFIKTNFFSQLMTDSTLPCNFSVFVKLCRAKDLKMQAVNVAGLVLDLETEDGLLTLCGKRLSEIRSTRFEIRKSKKMYKDARLIGKVLLGENVSIGPKVIIIGPTIVGDNVTIEKEAVIYSSLIGSNVSILPGQFIQNRVIMSTEFGRKHEVESISYYASPICSNEYFLNRLKAEQSPFRNWPGFSYARCFKRIIDFFAAIIILAIFAPIIPFIALAIKISSPGPIFFKDKRQGLHGKVFYCLKFRTMTVGAAKIQEKLRVISEVDGPQFKMTDDPRLNAVGRFLRETYIDEIPQFLNVLIGQMSAVGPRPSPESENTLCPSWRDARLSVRPGITGLWQVCRTRQPMKDFQEWIYYDTKYVRDLSLKMDLRISWQTIKKMIDKFITQF